MSSLFSRYAALLMVTDLVSSCDSLTRLSKSAKFSGVINGECFADGVQNVAGAQGRFDRNLGANSAQSGAGIGKRETLFFEPNPDSNILPIEIRLLQENGYSTLVQEFRDLGPEHSQPRITATLDFMSAVEDEVAKVSRLSIGGQGQAAPLSRLRSRRHRIVSGSCTDKSLSLSKPNAIILKSLLSDFASGKVDQKNLDSVYQ